MILNSSIESMVERIKYNRQFPKYQFERSFDVFLSLFLEEYFSAKYQDRFTYVAAEFPMRKEKSSYQSTNVDYLLLRERKPQWYFIELKTDQRSQRDIQLKKLAEANGKPFSEFYNQIDCIKQKSKQVAKYDALLKSIGEYLKEDNKHATVKSICLTNFNPKQSIKDTHGDKITWLKLSEFDTMLKETKHPELWRKVKILFEDSDLTPKYGC